MIGRLKNLAYVTLLALIFAAPAHATPPTVITIEDQPFGVSDEELFLLRTTQDNLGSHFHNQSETFLVAVNLWNGSETLWHVDSVQVTTVFGDEGEKDRREVIREGRAGLANPFAILAERGGLPWGTVSSLQQVRPDSIFTVRGDAVTGTNAREESFALSKAKAVKQLRTSLTALSHQIPNYARLESITTREQFAAAGFADETCRFTDAGRGFSPWTYKSLQLVRLTCTDEEEIGGVSFVLVAEAGT